jgi:hypothetical protein
VTSLLRRTLLAGAALAVPATPVLTAPPEIDEGADLARNFETALARFHGLDRDLHACLERAGELQQAVHAAEDRLCEAIEAVEAWRPATPREALARQRLLDAEQDWHSQRGF